MEESKGKEIEVDKGGKTVDILASDFTDYVSRETMGSVLGSNDWRAMIADPKKHDTRQTSLYI